VMLANSSRILLVTCECLMLQWYYSGITVLLQWCHSGSLYLIQQRGDERSNLGLDSLITVYFSRSDV
jgi:hypothetical protein